MTVKVNLIRSAIEFKGWRILCRVCHAQMIHGWDGSIEKWVCPECGHEVRLDAEKIFS